MAYIEISDVPVFVGGAWEFSNRQVQLHILGINLVIYRDSMSSCIVAMVVGNNQSGVKWLTAAWEKFANDETVTSEDPDLRVVLENFSKYIVLSSAV